jgi:hypothetical protein
LKGGRPPEGYKLFIGRKYVLAHEDGTHIELTDGMGEILSIIMGARGYPVSGTEIARIMYAHRDDCGPFWGRKVVAVQIHHMKKRLKSGGIEVIIRSTPGTDGYRFKGFRRCEKTSDRFVRIKKQRTPEELEQYKLAHRAPWAFPARHKDGESRRWDWKWNDYMDESGIERD